MTIKNNWIYNEPDTEFLREIIKTFNLKKSIANIIIRRGFKDLDEIDFFLNPNLNRLPEPSLLKDLKKGAERLASAIFKGEKIAVYGDYDADGITATALVLLFLKDIGIKADFYIPDRIKEGYGLNKDAIDLLKSRGAQLVITVDCGINGIEIVKYAKEIGIDFIITDHHVAGEELPPATAVINPKRKDCNFPFKELAGVGVAFYLLIELRKTLRKQGYFKNIHEPNLKQYLDLVAIGTIADLVPLLGPNRIFVKYGLEEINKTRKKGLIALREELLIETLDVKSVSFRIAPRINASGRVSSPLEALKLLLTTDEDKARELVKQLHKNNSQRQKFEETVLNEAIEQKEINGERMSYCLYSPDWHIGVLGIVAGKMVDKYKRPFFVFTKDQTGLLKGSGRSIEGFPLEEILFNLKDLLVQYGGHRLACGVTLEEKNLRKFSEELEKMAKRMLSNNNLCQLFHIDGPLEVNEIDDNFFKQLHILEPFGAGNPEPILCMNNVEVLNFRYVGSKENHLKLFLKRNDLSFNAIGFSLPNNGISENSIIDIIGIPKLTEYNGQKRWDFYVKDYNVRQ
ncbi:MAG: single-stranded-DNA-specific exonuclease RecJ [Proteobacteria bacterium]|nr:single-stranded-DNA-specific exonuclease RecJ [Pseudomonadota bacterium]